MAVGEPEDPGSSVGRDPGTWPPQVEMRPASRRVLSSGAEATRRHATSLSVPPEMGPSKAPANRSRFLRGLTLGGGRRGWHDAHRGSGDDGVRRELLSWSADREALMRRVRWVVAACAVAAACSSGGGAEDVDSRTPVRSPAASPSPRDQLEVERLRAVNVPRPFGVGPADVARARDGSRW